MVGIYLSGTGNTKYCVEKLVQALDETSQVIPMEDDRAIELVKSNQFIVIGYPIQFSNAPVMVRDFIKLHANVWMRKQVLCVVTMGAFSGDGAGCTARILKKYGADVVGGLHIRMPDSVCDSKLLKKSLSDNQKIVKNADWKTETTAVAIKNGKYPKEGLGFFYHVAGLLGQRLWFYHKTRNYSDKLKINDACIGCGLCEKSCPMHNIKIQDGKAVSGQQCTMCYRCISLCPQRAITLLGKEVKEQVRLENMIR